MIKHLIHVEHGKKIDKLIMPFSEKEMAIDVARAWAETKYGKNCYVAYGWRIEG